jgi:transcriptional regulator with XRE-family HTH domain
MATVDGTFVRTQREAKGYTTKQFAEELGISTDYLANIENGHRTLKRRPDLIKRMADLLDTPYPKLLKMTTALEREVAS